MRAAALLLLAAVLAAPAAAEVHLRAVSWELGFRSKARAPLRFRRIERLKRTSGQAAAGRLRAVVELENDPGRAAEAVLLRYALTARLAPLEGAGEPRWVVPFQVEERRIPRVKGGRTQQVPLDTLRIEDYLRSLRSTGYWPVALRIQVMAEPRGGVRLDDAMAEAELPIDWNLP